MILVASSHGTLVGSLYCSIDNDSKGRRGWEEMASLDLAGKDDDI